MIFDYDQRYSELREQSHFFDNKNMIKHHFVRNMKEVALSAFEIAGQICEAKGYKDAAMAIRARAEMEGNPMKRVARSVT